MDEVIAERCGNNGRLAGVNVGNMSETNVGNALEVELSDRQRYIVSIIKANPNVTGKEMNFLQVRQGK